MRYLIVLKKNKGKLIFESGLDLLSIYNLLNTSNNFIRVDNRLIVNKKHISHIVEIDETNEESLLSYIK